MGFARLCHPNGTGNAAPDSFGGCPTFGRLGAPIDPESVDLRTHCVTKVTTNGTPIAYDALLLEGQVHVRAGSAQGGRVFGGLRPVVCVVSGTGACETGSCSNE